MRDYHADVVLCTHTGIKWQRASQEASGERGDDSQAENDGMPNVWYSILTAEDGLRVEFVPVHYEHGPWPARWKRKDFRQFVETVRTGWWTTCLEILPAKERARESIEP
jgi:hypothetical protein